MDGKPGLELVERVEEVLTGVLQGVDDGAQDCTAGAIHHLSRREVVILLWSVPESKQHPRQVAGPLTSTGR